VPGDDQTPVPDPTVLTTEALARAIDAQREYVVAQLGIRDERLRGIDTATRVLNETVNRVPTDVEREVAHLRELAFEKVASLQSALDRLDSSISLQFSERDTRSEREARDNTKAVDAAFAAQEKAAVEQNRSNQLAISKSEAQTIEAIAKLGELFKSTTDALAGQLGDLKERVGAVEKLKEGGQQTLTGIYALAGFVLVVLLIVGAALALKP
jgi:uncharacterized protein YoxC